jgi:prepilin-type N-terminal cleavage/methylation domain-containing protein
MAAMMPMRKLFPKRYRARQKGFTVIELLVGMTVFVVVLSISVGTFIRGLRLQRNTVSLITVNDNLSLVLEQIAREARTGSEFDISSPGALCPTVVGALNVCSGSAFEFSSAAAGRVGYRLQGDAIERGTGISGAPVTNFVPITSDNVTIANLLVRLEYVFSGGLQQAPRVTISLVGNSSDSDPFLSNVKVRLQATVSSRS